MIAGCPKCEARYRVDPARIGPQGARLRCSRCQTVFRVRPAAAEQVDRARLVLVADSDPQSGKRMAAAISGWGLEAMVVHDGVEAMLAIQRLLPLAVVLDAGLPKMLGAQVCEIVKRNQSLRTIHVVLVAAVDAPERTRRESAEAYGADVVLERPDLPDGLGPLLRRFGYSLTLPMDRSGPELPPPVPPAAEPDDARAAERENAARLARIIVSDIALYNPEKLAAAIAAGNVLEALDSELAEGRELLAQRVGQAVRAERDYLAEEVMRVARERGMR